MRKYLMPAMLVVAVSSCGKGDEKTIVVKEANGVTTTATATANGDKMTIKADNGKFTMETNGKVTFSDAAPQYPGSTISSTMVANNDGKASNIIAMQTTDKPVDVLAFYKQKMIAAKRAISTESSTPEGGMILSGNDADSLMITVASENNKTNVTIITSKGH